MSAGNWRSMRNKTLSFSINNIPSWISRRLLEHTHHDVSQHRQHGADGLRQDDAGPDAGHRKAECERCLPLPGRQVLDTGAIDLRRIGAEEEAEADDPRCESGDAEAQVGSVE